ncbi:hypothetical protein [Frankia sp. AgPm24]|uniref:nSTAND1 domain-containing NTPase n=1 Tax=Frankia sp. AgPm24 TaxID=631128 RepID=UPI0035B23D29
MTSRAEDGPFSVARPFVPAAEALFFGRAAAAHSLLAKWLDSRLVVVYGPTGAGKSSLIRAGVLPNCSDRDADVLALGRVRPLADGDLGMGTVAPAGSPQVNPFAAALLRSWSGPGDAAPLPPMLRDVLSGVGRGRPATCSQRPVLAAVDQFEELLAPHPPRLEVLREQFMTLLGAAVAAMPNLRLLLIIRQGSLAELAPYESILAAGGEITRVRVDPPDRGAAALALAEPARRVGGNLSPEVIDACLDDLTTSRVTDVAGAPSVLTSDTVQPLFLHLVMAAFERERAGHAEAVVAELPAWGATDVLLAAYLTQAIAQEARQYDLDAGEVRHWLAQTFITERGRRAGVDEGLATTAGMPTALLVALAERYVLVVEWRAGARRFELFDDRLIPVLQAAVPTWSIAGAAATEIGAADHLHAALISRVDGDDAAVRLHTGEVLRQEAADPRVRAQALLLLADIDSERGHLEQARAGYQDAAQLYESLPDVEASGRALAEAARLLLRTGRLGSAVAELQAAATRLPADANIQIDLGRALWYSGQRWAATALFSTALALAPRSAAALAGRGLLRVELGDDVAALEDLNRLDRLNPQAQQAVPAAETRAARALAMARLGQPAAASAETTAVLDDAADNGPVLWHAAEVFRVIGDDTRAEDLLRRAVEAREPALLPHQRREVDRLLGHPGAMA